MLRGQKKEQAVLREKVVFRYVLYFENYLFMVAVNVIMLFPCFIPFSVFTIYKDKNRWTAWNETFPSKAWCLILESISSCGYFCKPPPQVPT